MANSMTREHEFRKLNKQLDDELKKTTTLTKATATKHLNPQNGICYDTYRVEKSQASHSHNNNNISRNINDRFATYSKNKRSNLDLMCKVGGGDGTLKPKPQSPISPKAVKNNYGNTFGYCARTLPKDTGGAVGGTDDGNGCSGGQNMYNTTNTTKATGHLASKVRRATPKGTLVIYKNENFTDCASIDDLIKRSLLEEVQNEPDGKTEIGKQQEKFKSTQLSKHSHRNDESTRAMLMDKSKNSQNLVNTSSLIRFLHSKVALLEANQTRNMEEMAKQKEAYEELMQRQKSMTQQLEKSVNQVQSLTEQLEYANSQLHESQRRCREQSQENLTLRKENEASKRELKRLTLNITNMEKRYQRTKEEMENAQKTCGSMRQSERDVREQFQREIEVKNTEIKYLKKQRIDLFNAYKKQLFLIDNLRQQNACLEQAKMIDFCEKEFSKILEWNLKA